MGEGFKKSENFADIISGSSLLAVIRKNKKAASKSTKREHTTRYLWTLAARLTVQQMKTKASRQKGSGRIEGKGVLVARPPRSIMQTTLLLFIQCQHCHMCSGVPPAPQERMMMMLRALSEPRAASSREQTESIRVDGQADHRHIRQINSQSICAIILCHRKGPSFHD